MKIKTDIDFISFSDGICDIYTEDDVIKYKNLAFSNRALGIKRIFEASANLMVINKVIRIPLLNNIDTYDHVIINKINYEIKIIQPIYDSTPQSIDLSLQKI